MKIFFKILIFSCIFISSVACCLSSGRDVTVLTRDSTEIAGELLAVDDSVVVIEAHTQIHSTRDTTTDEKIVVISLRDILVVKINENDNYAISVLAGMSVGTLAAVSVISQPSDPNLDGSGVDVVLKGTQVLVAGMVFLGFSALGVLAGTYTQEEAESFEFNDATQTALWMHDTPKQITWTKAIKVLKGHAKSSGKHPRSIQDAIDVFSKK